MLFANIWKAGAGVVIVLLFAWALRLDHVRAGWAVKYSTLNAQSQAVLIATQQASGNPALKWPDVPSQIAALSASNIALKQAIDLNNGQVDSMNAETVRLKTAGDKLRAQLVQVQRDRAGVMLKLDGMASAPGERGSCPALISQTQDALDTTWGAGL